MEKINNENSKKNIQEKGILFSTINPLMNINMYKEEIDKDSFRGGTHLSRVYNVRNKIVNKEK